MIWGPKMKKDCGVIVTNDEGDATFDEKMKQRNWNLAKDFSFHVRWFGNTLKKWCDGSATGSVSTDRSLRDREWTDSTPNDNSPTDISSGEREFTEKRLTWCQLAVELRLTTSCCSTEGSLTTHKSHHTQTDRSPVELLNVRQLNVGQLTNSAPTNTQLTDCLSAEYPPAVLGSVRGIFYFCSGSTHYFSI